MHVIVGQGKKHGMLMRGAQCSTGRKMRFWDILRRNRIVAPVPYRLGWSRSSCMTCIYNGPRIWATIQRYFPKRAEAIASYEDQFGTTVSRNRINVIDLGSKAKPK